MILQSENSPTTIFGHGCKGVFVTCDRNRESNAATEVYRILENVGKHVFWVNLQYIEDVCVSDDNTQDNGGDALDLDKELEELTQKKHNSKFSRIDLVFLSFVQCVTLQGMKGITFIRILDETISPVAAVKHTFRKIKETGISPARYAARIIPIEYTCYAHMEDVVATVTKAIQETFTEELIGKSVGFSSSSLFLSFRVSHLQWFCSVKRRNNTTFDRESLIQTIAKQIDDRYPVCLKGGDICIHVDIDKGVCGISIITDWKELNEQVIE